MRICMFSKMSFKILQENLLKSKVFDPNYMQNQLEIKNQFDLKNNEIVPKRLRESLMSETTNHELNDFQEELTAVVFSRKEEVDKKIEALEDVTSWKVSQEPRHHSKIFMDLLNSHSSTSFKEISMTAIDSHNSDEASFLTITRLVALRDHSVIIHWNVKTTLGIRGYQIYLDGSLASTIFSSERTIALIKNVNMSVPHNFAIYVVPDKNLMQSIMQTESLLVKPVIYNHKPKIIKE